MRALAWQCQCEVARQNAQGGMRLKDKAGLFHLQDPNFGKRGSGRGVEWGLGIPMPVVPGHSLGTGHGGPDKTPRPLHRVILTAFQDIYPVL